MSYGGVSHRTAQDIGLACPPRAAATPHRGDNTMKIRNHRLARDDASALTYLACPHAGRGFSPRFLVLHYTAGSSAAGTVAWFCSQTPRVSAHRVIARGGTLPQNQARRREADVIGEANGVMDSGGWCHSTYPEAFL